MRCDMKVKPMVIALKVALLMGTAQPLFAAEEPDGEEAKDKSETVVVTGTRIKRESLSTPTPLIKVSRETIVDSGLGSLSEILTDQVPAISESLSNQNSQSQVSNTGISTINLRRLGTDRTLTLIDGRRTVSNSYNGNYISLSTIPAGLVESVEVITGGASAVYGSDAIAGVVNIITQSGKEGFDVNARYGYTPEGGGKEFSLDFDYGTSFANNDGYLYFSNSWDRQFGIAFEDRDRAQLEPRYRYRESELCNQMQTANGYQCMRDITPSDWRDRSDGIAGGVFEERSSGTRGYWFDESGLRDDWNEETYGVNSDQFVQLKVPDNKFSSAIKVDYNINDDLDAFFQVQYSSNKSINNKSPEDDYEGADVLFFDPVTGAPGEVRPGTISITNPFAPAEIANNAGSSISWDRRFYEVGNIITDNERTTIRSWAGLKGFMFDSSWDWEVALGLGSYEQKQLRHNELNVIRVAQALDAERLPDGTIQCVDADARAAGCVPLNIFGVNSITPEMADWIRATPQINTQIDQINLSGHMAGDLFELSSGPVAAAFGFDFRRDTQDLNTSEGHRNGGITFNVVPTFKGEIDVYEVFGELSVPLADNLIVDTSLRLADYSHPNIDLMSSYKLGFLWEPIDNYQVRASYSRAQRAPSITELLSPARGDFDGFDDICADVTATSMEPGHDNCRLEPGIAATIAANGIFEDENNGYSPNAGNDSLTEETADTYTVGFVYTSPSVEGLSFAVDYYDITVEDAIQSIANESILNSCYNSASVAFGSGNEFCNLIRRDADGQLIEILQREYNLDQISTRGYDVAAEYNFDTSEYGDFSLSLNWTHVVEHETIEPSNDGPVRINNLGFLDEGIFEDIAKLSIKWKYDNWRLSWRTRYLSSIIDDEGRLNDYMELRADPNNQAAFATGAAEVPLYLFFPSYMKHDLSVSYKMDLDDSDVRIYAGVRNVFDDKGPFIPNSGDVEASTRGNSSSFYDGSVGRFVYLGVDYSF